jgi:hypothetical protein
LITPPPLIAGDSHNSTIAFALCARAMRCIHRRDEVAAMLNPKAAGQPPAALFFRAVSADEPKTKPVDRQRALIDCLLRLPPSLDAGSRMAQF